MKRNKKHLLATLLLAGAMLLTTACGDSGNGDETGGGNSSASTPTSNEQSLGGSSEANPADATTGSQVLTVLLSEEPGAGDPLGTMLNNWASETGNTLDLQIIGYDDQLTKFPAMAKNNDLPDLIATTRLHRLYPEEFVDMSECFDLSKFENSALEIVAKDYTSGNIVSLPYTFTTTCMFYNADAFKKAGIEAPTLDNPWTWEELYANAKTLMEKGGVKYGFAADVSRARYDILMYANGGSMTLVDDDTFRVNVNCAENVSTLERFVEANNTVMPQALWSGATSDNPADYFKNGDVGIYLSGSWSYAGFASDISSFDFGVMPTPVGTVSQSAIIGGGALAVPRNGKNTDLAIEFLNWLFTPENFKTYIQMDKGLSSLKGVIYEPDTEEGKEDYTIIQGEAAYVTDTFSVDESASWRQYKDNEYRDYIERAVAGEMSAQEALDAFAKELSDASGWDIAK